MKAAVYDRYGRPDVLRIEDVPVPSPGRGQVLVEVAATSVNLSDWECLVGSPFYARIGGLRSPAKRTLGSDIAGRVTAVGEGVTRFRPGDEVYGDNLALMGGFAEYAVAAESALALKPAELTFAQACALPQSGAIALQGTAGAAPATSHTNATQLTELAGAVTVVQTCEGTTCRQGRGSLPEPRSPAAQASPSNPAKQKPHRTWRTPRRGTLGRCASVCSARSRPGGHRWSCIRGRPTCTAVGPTKSRT